jgi:hypothetical protein
MACSCPLASVPHLAHEEFRELVAALEHRAGGSVHQLGVAALRPVASTVASDKKVA